MQNSLHNLEIQDAILNSSKASKTRSETLTLAAGGLVFAHNKVLLDRSDSSDLWSFPGGVVNYSQSISEITVARLKEELNLDIEVSDTPPFLYQFQLENEGILQTVILVHFVVKVTSPAKIRMGGDIIDYRWEPMGSNFRDCYPNVKAAVDHFMKI